MTEAEATAALATAMLASDKRKVSALVVAATKEIVASVDAATMGDILEGVQEEHGAETVSAVVETVTRWAEEEKR